MSTKSAIRTSFEPPLNTVLAPNWAPTTFAAASTSANFHSTKPPAMNTAMWNHPVTSKQLAVLEQEWGVGNGGWFEVLRPMEKMLACGDTGSGAMRDWKAIVGAIEERLCLGYDAGADVMKK